MPAIRIEDLSKHYGRRVGVERVSLEVQSGEIFGFLGPNGAGKTTTIRVLMGLLRPTKGVATILGKDCWSEGIHVKAQVGYLPGDLRLYHWLAARRAVTLAENIRGEEFYENATRLIELFELEPGLAVKSMSRGTRQKLGLVLALAHRPAVVILDEPSASLDPIIQVRLYDELRSLAASGSCIFLSSHTLGEVERLCSRVAMIRRGRIVADETLEGLRRRSPRLVTLRWASEPPTDALDLAGIVQITERGPRLWRGELVGNAIELVTWCSQRPLADVSIEEPDLAALFESFYRV